MSEPKGRGANWTDERGTSEEGRRHLQSAPEASGRHSVSEFDELRALVREVIRDVLPHGLPANGMPVTETVDLSTDEDLATFVARLLDVDPGEREDLRAGRKRFRLGRESAGSAGVPDSSALLARQAPAPAPGSAAPPHPGHAPAPALGGPPVRRVESGAVTEALVRDAARAGERLVLGRAAVLTPLARDRARASGVEIVKER
jgi:hypothetical protein